MMDSGDGPLILVGDCGAGKKGCRQIFKLTALTTPLSYFCRIRDRNKGPQEHQREICEDYYPCELYAFNHGYAAAYKHYFGRRRTK